jgi:protein disulfide-isomerase A3
MLQIEAEEIENVYEGDGTSESIRSFIEKNVHGACGYRTSANSDEFKNPLIVIYFDFDYKKQSKYPNSIRNSLIKVAKKFEINFAISRPEDFKYDMSLFGVTDIDKDKIYVFGRNANKEKYILKEEFSAENVEKFADDLLNDKIEKFIRSQPIPETQQTDVIEIVAQNFNQLANDETKEILIEFYAPWCRHCQNLEPIYNDIAKKISTESEHIVLAKMDATSNDLTPFWSLKLTGYPLIAFIPKDKSKEPIIYEGDRSMEHLTQFIIQHSTLNLEALKPVKVEDEEVKKTEPKVDL